MPKVFSVRSYGFAFVFLIEVIFSNYLSTRSWFWTDESYALTTSLEHPLSDYLLGITSEGNRMPLYFLLQKFLISVIQHNWIPLDPYFLIRSLAIFPSALAVTLLCEKAFFKSKSVLFFLFVFLGLNSSTAVLGFSYQSRHYSLWVLASLFFSMALWRVLLLKRHQEKWRTVLPLVPSAYFLCLTVGIGMLEVGAGLLLILLSGKLKFKNFCTVSIAIAPVLIYSMVVSRGAAGFLFDIPSLQEYVILVASHARYWLVLLVGASFFFWGGVRNQKEYLLYISYLGMVTLLACFAFYLHRAPPGSGFTIANRYFIFLSPHLFYATLQVLPFPIQKNLRLFQVVLLLFSLSFVGKLYTRINPLLSVPHFHHEAVKKVEAVGIPGRCVCLIQGNWPEIHYWGALIPQIMAWNAKVPNCENPLPLNFQGKGVETLPLSELFVATGNFKEVKGNLRCKE